MPFLKPAAKWMRSTPAGQSGQDLHAAKPGTGGRSWWIRHEDWLEANKKADVIELLQ